MTHEERDREKKNKKMKSRFTFLNSKRGCCVWENVYDTYEQQNSGDEPVSQCNFVECGIARRMMCERIFNFQYCCFLLSSLLESEHTTYTNLKKKKTHTNCNNIERTARNEIRKEKKSEKKKNFKPKPTGNNNDT